MGSAFDAALKSIMERDAKMDPEKLYRELGHLAASAPDLWTTDNIDRDVQMWLGRVVARLEQSGDVGDSVDAAAFTAACRGLGPAHTHDDSVQMIFTILYRALARAEARAPAAAQGAFIPAGDVFTALAAVGKVLELARTSVLIIDPYADANLLTEFAVLARENIAVHVLADKTACKPGLKPAAERWAAQYGGKRPLQVRLAEKGSLHDRLIAIDDRHVWSVGQSFNAMAQRAPTSLVRADPETARMKIEGYNAIWRVADALP